MEIAIIEAEQPVFLPPSLVRRLIPACRVTIFERQIGFEKYGSAAVAAAMLRMPVLTLKN
ncbi:MAG: hypothetical protein R2778_11980 [Saprospiraceae bacterium]